jgi:hypothetical protein
MAVTPKVRLDGIGAIINAAAKLARERFSATAGWRQIRLRQQAEKGGGMPAPAEAMREGVRKLIPEVGDEILGMDVRY